MNRAELFSAPDEKHQCLREVPVALPPTPSLHICQSRSPIQSGGEEVSLHAFTATSL